jgi:hypothetical protein
VELRRVGYVTARADVELGDGATGEVTLEPREDPAAFAEHGGALALDVRETQVVVTVDGRARGLYASPLPLVVGAHRVRVERGDFEPLERDVTIDAGRTTTLSIALAPTPEYRARYVAHATTMRTWGWIGVVGGAAIAGSGLGLFLYDVGKRSGANDTISAIDAKSVPHANLGCDPFGDNNQAYVQNCEVARADAVDVVSRANSRDVFAFIGMGVGVAAIGTGIVLLVTGDDPHRYDVPADSARAPTTRVTPTLFGVRGGGGIGLAGIF